MKKKVRYILDIVEEVLEEMVYTILYVVKCSLYPLSQLLIVILPYLMILVTLALYKERGHYAVGGELFIPIVFFIISYFLKSVANKIGKGETPPIPEERFTTESSEGEVSCEYSRLQEMLLFVNDYEKWLERKGLLRK